jgi:hypothetical protein
LSLWYVQRETVQLSCEKISTISKQTETRFHMSLVNLVRLAQTMQLSCSKTKTVTERTETRLHMSHIT